VIDSGSVEPLPDSKRDVNHSSHFSSVLDMRLLRSVGSVGRSSVTSWSSKPFVPAFAASLMETMRSSSFWSLAGPKPMLTQRGVLIRRPSISEVWLLLDAKCGMKDVGEKAVATPR